MYKKAVQLKLRFPFRGQASVEDLFDLGLETLDDIYKMLKRQERQSEDGLLEERSAKDERLALKLAIVRDVFETKQGEIEAAKDAAQRRARKQRIMSIIADKQDAELVEKDLDELQKMLDEL